MLLWVWDWPKAAQVCWAGVRLKGRKTRLPVRLWKAEAQEPSKVRAPQKKETTPEASLTCFKMCLWPALCLWLVLLDQHPYWKDNLRCWRNMSHFAKPARWEQWLVLSWVVLGVFPKFRTILSSFGFSLLWMLTSFQRWTSVLWIYYRK